MGKPNKHRNSYTVEFKLKAVQFSTKKSYSAAAKLFHVSIKSLKKWCNQQKDLCFAVHNRKWRNGRGNILTETTEQDFYNWVNDQMALYAPSATSPDTQQQQIEGNDIVKSKDLNEQQSDNHNSTTTITEYEDHELSEFHRNIRSLHAVYDYQLMDVGIVGETTVPFIISDNTAYATILLSALADGTKLKPLVIFNSHDLPPSIKIPPDVHVCVAKRGTPEEPEILWWLKHIWKLNKHNNHRLLISSISNGAGQESLQTLAKKYCLTDVIQVPDSSKKSDFLSALFCKMLQISVLSSDILEFVNYTWKRLTEQSIIDGFVDKDIVSADDVYVKDDATDFLGFSQEDIDTAKQNAVRVNKDANDVINTLL